MALLAAMGVAACGPSAAQCADSFCIVGSGSSCVAEHAACCGGQIFCGSGTLATDAGSCTLSSATNGGCR